MRAHIAPWLAIALTCAACTAPNAGLLADQSLPADGAAPVDDGGAGLDEGPVAQSCPAIRDRVTALLAASKTCRSDKDCVLATTACGLPGACGDAYEDQGWRGPEMDLLLQEWTTQMCGPLPCPPCPGGPFLPPACNAGTCGPRGALLPIGAPCTADGQCLTGQCLTEGQDPTYVGGYCTLKGCGGGTPCPAGSDCRGGALTGGTTVAICLAQCGLLDTCRTGYGCCSGPGPRRDLAWCAPSRSPLCLAR